VGRSRNFQWGDGILGAETLVGFKGRTHAGGSGSEAEYFYISDIQFRLQFLTITLSVYRK